MTRVTAGLRPVPIAANGTLVVKGESIGGFLPSAGGTIAVDDPDGNAVIAATTVTAGVYIPLPCYFGKPGAEVTLASDAAGSLFIG